MPKNTLKPIDLAKKFLNALENDDIEIIREDIINHSENIVKGLRQLYPRDLVSLSHYTVRKGAANILDLLAEQGHSLFDKDNRRKTPMHVAVFERHWACVEVLIKHNGYEYCNEILYLALSYDAPLSTIQVIKQNLEKNSIYSTYFQNIFNSYSTNRTNRTNLFWVMIDKNSTVEMWEMILTMFRDSSRISDVIEAIVSGLSYKTNQVSPIESLIKQNCYAQIVVIVDYLVAAIPRVDWDTVKCIHSLISSSLIFAENTENLDKRICEYLVNKQIPNPEKTLSVLIGWSNSSNFVDNVEHFEEKLSEHPYIYVLLKEKAGYGTDFNILLKLIEKRCLNIIIYLLNNKQRFGFNSTSFCSEYLLNKAISYHSWAVVYLFLTTENYINEFYSLTYTLRNAVKSNAPTYLIDLLIEKIQPLINPDNAFEIYGKPFAYFMTADEPTALASAIKRKEVELVIRLMSLDVKTREVQEKVISAICAILSNTSENRLSFIQWMVKEIGDENCIPIFHKLISFRDQMDSDKKKVINETLICGLIMAMKVGASTICKLLLAPSILDAEMFVQLKRRNINLIDLAIKIADSGVLEATLAQPMVCKIQKMKEHPIISVAHLQRWEMVKIFFNLDSNHFFSIDQLEKFEATEILSICLFFACECGNSEIVQLLMDKGADPNFRMTSGNSLHQYSKGRTPLSVAVQWNNESIIKILLTKGVDVTLEDNDGNNAIDIALQYNHEHLLPLLAEIYFKQSAVFDRRKSARHTEKMLLIAAKCNLHEQVVRLVTSGVALNTKDHKGNTPLHYAYLNKNQDTIKFLLEKGADKTATNNQKETPGHELDYLRQAEIFTQHRQNTHEKDVELSVRVSLFALKNRYPHAISPQVVDSSLAEVSKYLDAQPGSTKKSEALVIFGSICSKKDKHSTVNLTRAEILSIVWIAINDIDAIPEEHCIPDQYIATRREALLDKLQRIMYGNGHKRAACFGGTINLLVESLNRAHPDVNVEYVNADPFQLFLDYTRQFLFMLANNQKNIREKIDYAFAWLKRAEEDEEQNLALEDIKPRLQNNLFDAFKDLIKQNENDNKPLDKALIIEFIQKLKEIEPAKIYIDRNANENMSEIELLLINILSLEADRRSFVHAQVVADLKSMASTLWANDAEQAKLYPLLSAKYRRFKESNILYHQVTELRESIENANAMTYYESLKRNVISMLKEITKPDFDEQQHVKLCFFLSTSCHRFKDVNLLYHKVNELLESTNNPLATAYYESLKQNTDATLKQIDEHNFEEQWLSLNLLISALESFQESSRMLLMIAPANEKLIDESWQKIIIYATKLQLDHVGLSRTIEQFTLWQEIEADEQAIQKKAKNPPPQSNIVFDFFRSPKEHEDIPLVDFKDHSNTCSTNENNSPTLSSFSSTSHR